MVSPDLLSDKAPALDSVDGTEIQWKPKKNLCVVETRKKQKAKSGKKQGQVMAYSLAHTFHLILSVTVIGAFYPCACN